MDSNYLKEMFNCIPNTQLFFKDLDGKFTGCNDEFKTHLGVTSESDIIGMSDYDFFTKVIASVFVKDDVKVFKTKKPLTNRLEMIPVGFELYWFVTNKFPLFDDNNELIGLVGFTTKFKKSDQVLGVKNKFEAVIQYIEDNLNNNIMLVKDLADRAGMSVSVFERYFRKVLNESPMNYIKRLRVQIACNKLEDEMDISMDTVVTECGFTDKETFFTTFKQEMGLTPDEYKSQKQVKVFS